MGCCLQKDHRHVLHQETRQLIKSRRTAGGTFSSTRHARRDLEDDVVMSVEDEKEEVKFVPAVDVSPPKPFDQQLPDPLRDHRVALISRLYPQYEKPQILLSRFCPDPPAAKDSNAEYILRVVEYGLERRFNRRAFDDTFLRPNFISSYSSHIVPLSASLVPQTEWETVFKVMSVLVRHRDDRYATEWERRESLRLGVKFLGPLGTLSHDEMKQVPELLANEKLIQERIILRDKLLRTIPIHWFADREADEKAPDEAQDMTAHTPLRRIGQELILPLLVVVEKIILSTTEWPSLQKQALAQGPTSPGPMIPIMNVTMANVLDLFDKSGSQVEFEYADTDLAPFFHSRGYESHTPAERRELRVQFREYNRTCMYNSRLQRAFLHWKAGTIRECGMYLQAHALADDPPLAGHEKSIPRLSSSLLVEFVNRLHLEGLFGLRHTRPHPLRLRLPTIYWLWKNGLFGSDFFIKFDRFPDGWLHNAWFRHTFSSEWRNDHDVTTTKDAAQLAKKSYNMTRLFDADYVSKTNKSAWTEEDKNGLLEITFMHTRTHKHTTLPNGVHATGDAFWSQLPSQLPLDKMDQDLRIWVRGALLNPDVRILKEILDQGYASELYGIFRRSIFNIIPSSRAPLVHTLQHTLANDSLWQNFILLFRHPHSIQYRQSRSKIEADPFIELIFVFALVMLRGLVTLGRDDKDNMGVVSLNVPVNKKDLLLDSDVTNELQQMSDSQRSGQRVLAVNRLFRILAENGYTESKLFETPNLGMFFPVEFIVLHRIYLKNVFAQTISTAASESGLALELLGGPNLIIGEYMASNKRPIKL